MLLELSISNFAIIEQTTIRFTEGLNALTGETGAGKSILLDALGAVLGARVNSDLVRTGEKLARVEAAFDPGDLTGHPVADLLDGLGVDMAVEESLILSREITSNGRSSARINGRMTTAGILAQVGAGLVDIHGQSDHLAILKSTEQRNLLDRYGSLDADRAGVGTLVHEWHALRRQIHELTRDARDRAQRLDLLRFQVDEIDAAALAVGEDETLGQERDVLRNADRLRADALEALALLTDEDGVTETGTVAQLLRVLVTRVGDIATLDASSGELGERANELLVLAEDLARDLRDYAESVEANEERLQEIEDRIALMQSLKRKYGTTIAEVLEFGEAARRSLQELSSGEFDAAVLQEREAMLAASIASKAKRLSAARQKAARTLAKAIEQSIAELNMGRADLEIAVRRRPDPNGIEIDGELVHVDESGSDEIEFLIAPNAGESLKPLARIASGGETARLMLATKSILSEADLTPTLVFDEIDVGVGGRSGQVVGEKLWSISRNHQVIVVSHLAQIASFAETHLKIEKNVAGGRTVSAVRALEPDERTIELAAMLDGLPVTESALAAASEMLARSQSFVASAAAGAA